MLNGETWLLHSSVFENWVIERSDWVSSLGWFDKLVKTAASSNGWIAIGKKSLNDTDVLSIVQVENAKGMMFSFKDSEFSYYPGPTILRYQNKIAGIAGPKEVIEKCKEASENPWEWEKIQVIDVDAVLSFTFVDIPLSTKTLAAFDVAQNIAKGWMIVSLTGDASREAVDAASSGKTICKLQDGVWAIDTEKFNISSVRVKTSFDVSDLRTALESVTTKFVWVSDLREWPGWLPESDDDLNNLHVWSGGTEMFIPVEKFLLVTETISDLNSFPGIVFHDREL
jgi:hypothetical protein